MSLKPPDGIARNRTSIDRPPDREAIEGQGLLAAQKVATKMTLSHSGKQRPLLCIAVTSSL